MRSRLSPASMGRLGEQVARPAYDRSAVSPGIVHLGVGAFHRAHQAVVIDDCLAAGEPSWGIEGFSLRGTRTRDALGPQDGLYTLAVRDGAREALRVIGSLKSVAVAPENPETLLSRLADPCIRIVTLTVTEKAYGRDASGNLDADDANIRHDLEHPDSPRTPFGFLLGGLLRRRRAGEAPFAVVSCDNLPANGAALRRLLGQFAELRDARAACFVRDDVAFPSTMVDRIVPATTDADRAGVAERLGLDDAWPVCAEPFWQWVVEDDFPAGRPDWERFGVEMTRDVRPFESMKLRLLNGAHSAIAYLGLLRGHDTVARAFSDPAIKAFVEGLWAETAMTLSYGLDADGYAARLRARFANAALAHATAQIANDGGQKLPQRIVAPALERLASGAPAVRLAFVLAAWIEACAARGAAAAFSDPLDAKLAGLAMPGRDAEDIADAVFMVAGFGRDHPQRGGLVALAAGSLRAIRENGVGAALAELEARS